MELLQQSILPVLLIVMGLGFITIGFLGIFKKKPFIVSSRWQTFSMIIALSPVFLTMLVMAVSANDISTLFTIALWCAGGLMIALLIRALMLVKGYMAFGVNDESFRHVLLSTLSELNISYQEQLSRLVLPDNNMQLRITILSRSGTGHISPSGDVKQELFKKIIHTMNHKLATGPYELNKKGYSTNVLIGICLVVAAFIVNA